MFDGRAVPARGTISTKSARRSKISWRPGVNERVSHTLSVAGEAGVSPGLFCRRRPERQRDNILRCLGSSNHAVMDRASDLVAILFHAPSSSFLNWSRCAPSIWSTDSARAIRHAERATDGRCERRASGSSHRCRPVDRGPVYNWNGINVERQLCGPADALDDLIQLNTAT